MQNALLAATAGLDPNTYARPYPGTQPNVTVTTFGNDQQKLPTPAQPAGPAPAAPTPAPPAPSPIAAVAKPLLGYALAAILGASGLGGIVALVSSFHAAAPNQTTTVNPIDLEVKLLDGLLQGKVLPSK